MNRRIIISVLTCCVLQSALSQGILDNEFGTNGAATFLNEAEFPTYVHDMVLQTDGKILICGENFVSNDFTSGFLMQLDSDGTPDPGFGENGVARFASGSIESATFNGLRLLDNGDILVMGTVQMPENLTHVHFTRMSATGELISELNDGEPSAIISSNSYLYHFEQTPQGKLVLMYVLNPFQTSFPVAGDIYIHQFNNDGTPDSGFADNGLIIIGEESFDDRAYDMVVNQNGDIYVSGYSRDAATFGAFAQAMVVGLTSTGSSISSFGNNGIALISESNANLSANTLDLMPNQSVVFAGFRYSPLDFTQYGILGKLSSNGTVDTNFGNQSIGIVPVPEFTNGEFEDVMVMPDNQIIATGKAEGSGKDVILIRRNAQGQVTPGFGTDGNALPWDLSGGDDVPIKMMQDNGDVLICGNGITSGGTNNEISFVLRYSNTLITDITEMPTSSVVMYPNSANDFVILNNVRSGSVITIFDLAGKAIYLSNANSSQTIINASDFSNGLYYVQIEHHNNFESRKFMVNK